MSLDATVWAWRQKGISPTMKLILLSLADRAGEGHACWPSCARLEADTGLDKKTIYAGISALIEAGLIEDTGRKIGQGVRILRLIGVAGREGTLPKNGIPSEEPYPKTGSDPTQKRVGNPTQKRVTESPNESIKNPRVRAKSFYQNGEEERESVSYETSRHPAIYAERMRKPADPPSFATPEVAQAHLESVKKRLGMRA